MDSAFLPFNSSNASESDDLNAYISDLLNQQSSASSASAPYTNYGGNGFDGLFTANGDLTTAETSFCDGLPTDLTWDDYVLVTEGLPLDGAPGTKTPVGNAPGVSDINLAAGSADIKASGPPSMFNFGAESAGINMPVGFPTPNPAAGNTGINVPGSLPMSNLASENTGIMRLGAPETFDFAAGSANGNMSVGPQMVNLSADITGIDVPVGLQTTIEHPSYLGCGNGGFPNDTIVGDSMVNRGWIGTSQQVRQPIIGIRAPLALPNTHFNMSSSSETQSPKRHNPPSARHTTLQRRGCERAPSPAAMVPSNTSSETQSPPKRSRSNSPSARPPSKRPRVSRVKPTIRFVHDERSMPVNFRANPDNHGRFQYTATGRRKYLNGPGAVQERRRRREGNQGADQQGGDQQGKEGK